MTEFEKAKRWRERHNLSADQLGELTGYGRRSIFWMERGESPPNGVNKKPRKVAPWVWHRYRMMCAGVDAQLRTGEKFKW